jgi:hypothetical protein
MQLSVVVHRLAVAAVQSLAAGLEPVPQLAREPALAPAGQPDPLTAPR